MRLERCECTSYSLLYPILTTCRSVECLEDLKVESVRVIVNPGQFIEAPRLTSKNT